MITTSHLSPNTSSKTRESLVQYLGLSIEIYKSRAHNRAVIYQNDAPPPMKNLTQHLTQYAEYHRNTRNIISHFIGIPLIVLGFTALLSRPSFEIVGYLSSPALLIAVIASLFYLKLDLWMGAVMSVLMALSVLFGRYTAEQSTTYWLSMSIGFFFVGWVIQFIGHVYEKRKPAFVDDIMGLAIGPLFVLAELVFLLGFRKELKENIESVAGPTRNS
ncbi:MAG: DUF962 domain-containing protein [Cellvibrionaceae bacterium]